MDLNRNGKKDINIRGHCRSIYSKVVSSYRELQQYGSSTSETRLKQSLRYTWWSTFKAAAPPPVLQLFGNYPGISCRVQQSVIWLGHARWQVATTLNCHGSVTAVSSSRVSCRLQKRVSCANLPGYRLTPCNTDGTQKCDIAWRLKKNMFSFAWTRTPSLVEAPGYDSACVCQVAAVKIAPWVWLLLYYMSKSSPPVKESFGHKEWQLSARCWKGWMMWK